jgi:serine/threonine protein kinase
MRKGTPKEIQTYKSAFTTYRHVAQIGSGGAGTVVKVEDEDHAIFAVKYLSPEGLSSEKVKRFKNELAFCAENEHANVVKVLDWGRVEIKGAECPFYVMPYYGSNLRALMKTGIPPNRILPCFSQILDGVEAAHLHGVWHRDLKPENVLHDPTKDVLVVADFGIARFSEAQLRTIVETRPAARLANFQYAAPEQRERGGVVDQRADIYALGLILNEMFTGRLALGVNFHRIAEVHADSSYLDDLVDSMLRQSADHRPRDIAAIKQALIARKNAFVAEQKLSQLKKQVVPKAEIDDPLVLSPPQLAGVKWENGQLIFTLSQPVNSHWAQCFHNPGSHSAVMGCGPDAFRISGQTATVQCDGNSAQRVIDFTKQYVQMANQNYKALLERAARQRKAEEEAELRRRIDIAEKTKAINNTLKL